MVHVFHAFAYDAKRFHPIEQHSDRRVASSTISLRAGICAGKQHNWKDV